MSGAIQRIAMALPKEQGAAHYTLVRRNFEAAIKEFSIESDMANAWLDMHASGEGRLAKVSFCVKS